MPDTTIALTAAMMSADINSMEVKGSSFISCLSCSSKDAAKRREGLGGQVDTLALVGAVNGYDFVNRIDGSPYAGDRFRPIGKPAVSKIVCRGGH